ncbi:hypothetical protein [Natrinema salsiterrestre]|nr:hypothetical protein [Natrinema salsiterrestre]
MSDDALERGEDVVVFEFDGWFMLYDGTPGGWIRSRPPLQLQYWR